MCFRLAGCRATCDRNAHYGYGQPRDPLRFVVGDRLR
jgi:hypothetical protein